MIKQLFNSQSKSITSAAILISGASLVSRIIGLIRDRLFAHHFGAGEIMDAYYAAFKLPDLIYNLLIVGAISAGFIPVFTRLLISSNKSSAWRLANNILNMLGTAVLSLTVLGIVFMPRLMSLLAPGFSPQTSALAVNFGRIMFISMVILSASMIMGTIMQSLRSFFIFSIAPIFYNLGIIFGIYFFVPMFGTIGLAWGVVFGALLHLGLQVTAAYSVGYRWQSVFDWQDKNTRLIGRMMIPRALSLAVSQINILVITVLASILPLGSVAMYNYANNLQGVPIGLIGIPFALAVFPVLSASAGKNNLAEFTRSLSSAIGQILFLIIPVSIIFLMLRAQIVRVIYGTGAFDWTATVGTADILAFFSLSLFAQALIPLLGRAFFALENTKTPFVIGVISELVTIICALFLIKKIGLAGLALAFSIGSLLNLILLIAGLRRITKNLDLEKIFFSLWRVCLASMFMGVAIQSAKYVLADFLDQQFFWGIFLQGLLAGLIGLVIYGFICYILKLPEFFSFWNGFKRRARAGRPVKITESLEVKN